MTNKVVAPLVITKKEDGSDLYLYQGASLPDHLSDDEVKRLKEEGFVEDDSAKPASSKNSKPSAPSN